MASIRSDLLPQTSESQLANSAINAMVAALFVIHTFGQVNMSAFAMNAVKLPVIHLQPNLRYVHYHLHHHHQLQILNLSIRLPLPIVLFVVLERPFMMLFIAGNVQLVSAMKLEDM